MSAYENDSDNMPSKKKQLGAARRNRILLYFGIAAILLLTAVYQIAMMSRALTNQHPKFVDQFQEELDKALAMQQTVRRHIDDLSAAKAAGALTAEAHAQQLAESNGQIADLSKTIHDLQAKYVRLASSGSQAAASAAAAVGGGASPSSSSLSSSGVQEAARDLVQHARDEISEGSKAVEQSLRKALEQAAAASSIDTRFAAAVAGAALGSGAGAPSLRGSAAGAASSNGPFIHPDAPLNDPLANHGPGGKGHLIPHSTGAVDPGAVSRAAANADPATRAKQEKRAGQIRDAIAFVWKNYRQHAWGQDNLNPISGRGASAGFNHAVTLLDSLDTLWLAGLRTEFDEAVEYASKNLASKLRNVAGGTSVSDAAFRRVILDRCVMVVYYLVCNLILQCEMLSLPN